MIMDSDICVFYCNNEYKAERRKDLQSAELIEIVGTPTPEFCGEFSIFNLFQKHVEKSPILCYISVYESMRSKEIQW